MLLHADLVYLFEAGGIAVGGGLLVGFVFQSFALLPALTTRDNVMLPV